MPKQEEQGTDACTLSCLTLGSPAWSLTGHIQLEAEGQRGPDDAALRASFPGTGKGGEGAEQFRVEGTKKCPEHPF